MQHLIYLTNQGQTNKQVKFLARGNGYSVFLTPTEAVLTLRQTQKSSTAKSNAASLIYSSYLGGSNSVNGSGIAVYFRGNAYVIPFWILDFRFKDWELLCVPKPL